MKDKTEISFIQIKIYQQLIALMLTDNKNSLKIVKITKQESSI